MERFQELQRQHVTQPLDYGPTALWVSSGGEKATGVNPETKSGVEPLRQLDVSHDSLLAAPAAKLVPNVLLCAPLDYTSEAERGILTTGHPRISIHFAQACALERSLQCRCPQRLKQHGRQQLRVISQD